MRLLVLSLWFPRVVFLVLRIPGKVDEQSIPAVLGGLTPREPARHLRLSAAETARVIWNVLRWEKGRFNNGCFMRSFTRYHFFRLMGYPVVFHLGVESRPDGSGARDLRSHAWLTLDGAPFLEFEPERFAAYRRLYRYPE